MTFTTTGRTLVVTRAAALIATLLVAVAGVLATAGPAAAVFNHGDDRLHIETTLAALAGQPPTVPVVYLLGGSSARESITTEPAWTAVIEAFGGHAVAAYNFGSSSQTFSNDMAYVNAMPEVPSIVLIGLNVGRFCDPLPKAVSARGLAATAVYDSHRFHDGQQLSVAAKRKLAAAWLVDRYPVFKARYSGQIALLRQLIALCQQKGFCPVLVELPLNLPIIGHSWDGARNTYHAGARAVAAAYGIPYVDFIAHIGLVSHDFMDVSHLVEPGRAKYQARLSHEVVTRLKQYGLTP